MLRKKSCLLIAIGCLSLVLSSEAAKAEVRLAGVFGDHMVLQRDQLVPVWGWADPQEAVSVEFAGQMKTTKADGNGKWMIKLDKLEAGGPHTLQVAGANKLTLKDVLVGEVWLCSGQSNMAMTVSRAKDFEKEKQAATTPQIRHFKTGAHATPELQDDCKGSWQVCGPDTVGSFSATAYFFARKLHAELNVPIGLVNSSWGGTDVAAWTSLEAQKKQAAIVPTLQAYDATMKKYDAQQAKEKHQKQLAQWQERVKKAKAEGKPTPRRPRPPIDPVTNQNRPANLYNGMIHPLIPFAIRGAIWYQGERNSKSIATGRLYHIQLQTLINDWRARWAIGDFPFITVQLPNFHAPQEKPVETTGWVLVRDSMLKTLRMKNAGIAITTDVGEAKDIHPKNKQAVGQRLALWALGTTYERDILYSGPLMTFFQYRTATTDEDGKVTRPGRLTLSFLHADGLKTSDGEKLRGFAVADEDGKFFTANARIDKSTGMVHLSSKDVVTPVAARYNWADNPNGNLVNEAGLPAAPFRTDKFKLK